MNETRYSENGERSLASIVAEIRDEVKEFVQTRVEIFESELHEGAKSLKKALPLFAISATLLGTAYFLLTLALVAVIVVAFGDNPYRWFFSLLIVGALWSIAGVTMAYLAFNELRAEGTFPRKTVAILKADKNWLEAEVRGNL